MEGIVMVRAKKKEMEKGVKEEILKIVKKSDGHYSFDRLIDLSIQKTAERIIELVKFESELSIGDYVFGTDDWIPDEELEEQNKSTCKQIIKNIEEKFGL